MSKGISDIEAWRATRRKELQADCDRRGWKVTIRLQLTREIDDPLVDKIIRLSAAEYQVEVADIYDLKKTRSASDARHTAIHLCKSMNKQITLVMMGRIFNRSHTSIIGSNKQTDHLIQYNITFREHYENIRKQL